jgi:hypothetical protein
MLMSQILTGPCYSHHQVHKSMCPSWLHSHKADFGFCRTLSTRVKDAQTVSVRCLILKAVQSVEALSIIVVFSL